MWSFESICYVALNSRLHLITGKADADALRMSDAMSEFMQYTYDHDIAPSIWRYYHTPSFKRLMRLHDELTEITRKFVDTALQRIEAEGNKEARKSVFERLLRLDRNIAVVMAIDMLFGGLDTVKLIVAYCDFSILLFNFFFYILDFLHCDNCAIFSGKKSE